MLLIRFLGRSFLTLFTYLGSVVFLAFESFHSLVTMPVRWRLAIRQVLEVGYRSQMVVIVTGAFTGAVFGAQTYFQFHKLGMDTAVGAVVAVSMFRELGPVLTGLMVAGRVGAAMSAEIGTMKVTEQLDALRAMGVHPVDYLVVPRLIAMMISMPLLVAECVGMGIVAGKLVAVNLLGVLQVYYMDYMLKFTGARDVKMALTKGFVFGMLIVFIACHQGLKAREGAVGVGQATTQSVVIGSLAILIVNFFLTMVLNIFYPAGV
ncbi:MAG TPA: ABC transporter permease [Chthoniobacteraceae bacterium]|nr:ABC transporter permease [Chthoniobacteraceae bacterium]